MLKFYPLAIMNVKHHLQKLALHTSPQLFFATSKQLPVPIFNENGTYGINQLQKNDQAQCFWTFDWYSFFSGLESSAGSKK